VGIYIYYEASINLSLNRVVILTAICIHEVVVALGMSCRSKMLHLQFVRYNNPHFVPLYYEVKIPHFSFHFVLCSILPLILLYKFMACMYWHVSCI